MSPQSGYAEHTTQRRRTIIKLPNVSPLSHHSILTWEEENSRLTLRFAAAAAVLVVRLAKDEAVWPSLLHPALVSFLRGHVTNFGRGTTEQFEETLTKLWDKFGGTSEELSSQCDELLTCLELTLAQYPDENASYFETVRHWLDRTQRAELLKLALARSMHTSKRKMLHDVLFGADATPTTAVTAQNRPAAEHRTQPRLMKTQQCVADRLVRLGELFFDQNRPRLAIEPRLHPLIVGKTGAGKGHVISHVAQRLNCTLLHLTFGAWVVNGASAEYRPTLWAILDKLLDEDRLIVVIDEIDKFDADVTQNLSNWSRSCCNELWGLLDHRLPIDTFLKNARSDALNTPIIREILETRARSGLWIVGIGTWQNLHAKQTRAIGFAPDHTDAEVDSVASRLGTESGLSVELLYRFNPLPIILPYPTPAELNELLEETGIARLAKERGVNIDPNALDLSRGGMRVIEDLVTQILLAA